MHEGGHLARIVFLQRAPSLPTRQHLLHNCLSAHIKGKGKVSIGPFETFIVAQESLLQLSGGPGAGFQNFSEQRNLDSSTPLSASDPVSLWWAPKPADFFSPTSDSDESLL